MGKKRKPADSECANLVAELADVSRQLSLLATGPTPPPLWRLRPLTRRLAALAERVRVAAGLGEQPLFWTGDGGVYDATRNPPANGRKG